MTWDPYKRKYWETNTTLANAPLSRMLKAIIQCDGKIHNTFCLGKQINSSKLIGENRYYRADLIISLPIGSEEDFENISKCKLEEPSNINLS